MELHKNIKLLTWFNFFVDFRLYAPVAIIYFANITGSYALGLSVFSIEMIFNSIFQIPTGYVSDFFGRKRTIILGSLAYIICLIFYALARDFWFLAFGAIFSGLAGAFWSGNNSALLHDSLKEIEMQHEYHEYSGKTGYTVQIGLAISSLLGSIIAAYSFPAVWWLTIIPALGTLIVSFKMVEPKITYMKSVNVLKHMKESIKIFKKKKRLRILTLAYVLNQGIGETSYAFAPAFINTIWPLWAIGIARMLASIGASIGMHISGKVTKKIGYYKNLVFGGLYNRFVGIFAVLFPNIASPLLMASTSFPTGLIWPAQDALFQKEYSSKQRATLGSLTSLVSNLFFGVFAFAFGFVADQLKPAHSLLVAYVMLFSVAFLYWFLFRKKK